MAATEWLRCPLLVSEPSSSGRPSFAAPGESNVTAMSRV